MSRLRFNKVRLIQTACLVLAFGIAILVYVFGGYGKRESILNENWNNTGKIYQPAFPVIKDLSVLQPEADDDVTFVTAFFDIGTFQKGAQHEDNSILYQGIEKYKFWMRNFEVVNNDVILFTDSKEVGDYFRFIRRKISPNKTKILHVNRDEFQGFQMAPKIRDIYSQKEYPKFFPNTVNENYSCAMHAKYDVIELVIQRKIYHTKYLAWIDIGYLRDKRNHAVKMKIPDNLKEDHISILQVKKFIEHVPAKTIIGKNMIWVGGGLFIGKPEYLIIFIEDYRRALKWLLSKNIMSTDQQVLYILYSKESHLNPRVPLQIYYHHCRRDWFHIGKLMMGEYATHSDKQTPCNE